MTHITVDVPLVQCVGGHGGVNVPHSNGVVRRAGDEGAGGKQALHSFSWWWVCLHTPNAGRMVEIRVGLSNLQCIKLYICKTFESLTEGNINETSNHYLIFLARKRIIKGFEIDLDGEENLMLHFPKNHKIQ